MPNANPLLYFYYINSKQGSGSIQLENKTVWITGASSGIGAELAMQLLYTGVRI